MVVVVRHGGTWWWSHLDALEWLWWSLSVVVRVVVVGCGCCGHGCCGGKGTWKENNVVQVGMLSLGGLTKWSVHRSKKIYNPSLFCCSLLPGPH